MSPIEGRYVHLIFPSLQLLIWIVSDRRSSTLMTTLIVLVAMHGVLSSCLQFYPACLWSPALILIELDWLGTFLLQRFKCAFRDGWEEYTWVSIFKSILWGDGLERSFMNLLIVLRQSCLAQLFLGTETVIQFINPVALVTYLSLKFFMAIFSFQFLFFDAIQG